MRRHTVFECLQQEAELAVCLFFGESQHLKHFFLNVVLMDSDASASDLTSVQDDIISFRADCARIGIQKRNILIHRHCEWMMHRGKSVFLLRPLQQRELCDPDKTILVLVDQIHLLRQFQTQRAQNVPNQFIFVGCKQKQVACLSVHRLNQRFHLLFRHELGKGRFAGAILLDCDISQAFRSVSLCKFYQLVDLLARHASLAFRIDAANGTAGFQSIFEDCKFGIPDNVRNIDQFHAKTKIRFVGTETVHGLLPGHSLDRQGHFHAENLMEQIRQQTLIDIDHVFHVHK